MRVQGSIEAMGVITALIFIFLVIGTYVFWLSNQIRAYEEKVAFFTSCSKLQSNVVSSTFIDKNVTEVFLHEFNLDPTTRAAYSPEFTQLYCALLVPLDGQIIVPNEWEYPVNGTKFVGNSGLVNVTWGEYE